MPDPSLLLQSLEGLTIGDQFGETFFLDGEEERLIETRTLPDVDWVFKRRKDQIRFRSSSGVRRTTSTILKKRCGPPFRH